MIQKTKLIPTIRFAGATHYSAINFTFNDDGSIVVQDQHGNEITLSLAKMKFLTPLVLAEKDDKVIYTATQATNKIQVEFDFAALEARVKIRLHGNVALAGNLRLPITCHTRDAVANKDIAVDDSKFNTNKRIESVTVGVDGVESSLAFDFSDALGTWDKDEVSFPVSATFDLDPSVVSTVNADSATRNMPQRRNFIAAGREWVFFYDGSDYVFRSRVIDPLGSWSSSATWAAGSDQGYQLSLWWDGTKIHTAYNRGGDVTTIYYKSGTPQSGGTITADTEYTVASGGGNNKSYMTICLDSSNYPVLAYSVVGSSKFKPVYRIATATDGSSWGSETDLDSEHGSSHRLMPCVVPLSGNRDLLFIWEDRSDSKVNSRFYDGSTGLGSVTEIASYEINYGYCPVMLDNDTCMCLINVATTDSKCYEWTEDSWDSGTKIDDGVIACLCKNGNNAWAFVFDSSGTDTIYKVEYNGSWQTPASFDTPSNWASDGAFNCCYEVQSSRIGVIWIEGSGSPYSITYEYIELQEGWTNIAKVNGVTATDLAKVDGIAVADIAKINGVAV